MELSKQVPGFEKGTPDLGGQLRDLAKVVLALCEAEEARQEGAKAPEAPADTKTTSKPATRASAK